MVMRGCVANAPFLAFFVCFGLPLWVSFVAFFPVCAHSSSSPVCGRGAESGRIAGALHALLDYLRRVLQSGMLVFASLVALCALATAQSGGLCGNGNWGLDGTGTSGLNANLTGLWNISPPGWYLLKRRVILCTWA